MKEDEGRLILSVDKEWMQVSVSHERWQSDHLNYSSSHHIIRTFTANLIFFSPLMELVASSWFVI